MASASTTLSTDLLAGPLQGSLFAAAAAAPQPIAPVVQRTQLDPCCWIDQVSNWFGGADDLLETMLSTISWHRGQRLMYGRFVDEPRLTGIAELGAAPPLVRRLAHELAGHYGRPFDRMFCNYYRDGNDSVAWHADRVGRRQIDPLVAIITVGGPRPFRVRPFGGGESTAFNLHSGDLLVMGGAMQHHWEHSVPKQKFAPPRMSITLRTGPG